LAFDSAMQRRIMGKFATGITVVTSDGEAGQCGLTANAFTSVSLTPPLLLVCVDLRSSSHAAIIQNGCFAVNILAADQEDLSRRFATPGPKDFADLSITTAVTGSPLLAATLGHLDCRLSQRLPAGDHDIFLGEIVAGEVREGEPLLYFSGKYGHWHSLG